MKIFGFEISFRRGKSKSRVPGTIAPETGWQLRPTDGQGPFTQYFAQFVPRKIDPAFFEFLIESVPICGAAINRLVTLDGIPVVTGTNEALVAEINEWIQHVPVNDIQKGLQAFHQCLSREAFEQGFGLGEFITDKKRTDIVGLRVGDSKFIKFSRDDTGLRIYQRADNDQLERELAQDNLIYFSINNENQNPYGNPILRGCEFVAKIITTIYQATGNTWKRFGDPSYSVIYKTSKKDGTDLEGRKKTITDELNQAARAKEEGKSVDFVRAIDKDSEITIKVIGADNNVILEMDVPMKHLIEDVCGSIGLPAWMLGRSFSTTERRATFEAEMVLADVSVRQEAKTPHFERLIATMLRLRGRTWKPGDWKLEWKQVNLHDLVAQAQARFLNAQADQMMATAGSGSQQPAVPGAPPKTPPKHTKGCTCGCESPLTGIKETQRPTPWPALDDVEKVYEERLKSDWEDLRQRIFTIAKLTDADIAMGMVPPKGMKDGDIPPFTFTVEQRAQVMKAMEDFIGAYEPGAENSPVKWYYGQSYSLGLIQAARMVGQERPILDILKNREIFDELCANGFDLVKNNVTLAIQDSILAEMEAHVIAGSNPLSVANRLNKLFGNHNASWERLARTEMSMVAEQAKVDEWGKWGVNVKGAIIAGRDTHPRCRCANTVKKVDGKWYLLFVPAPDACPICMALATGPPGGV
jgi:hypothetical protein